VKYRYACLTILVSLISSSVSAQSGVQTLGVMIESGLTITPPTTSVSVLEGNSDSDTVFPVQTWTVTCNAANGGTVVFSASQPFVHDSDLSYKADVHLTLALGPVVEADWMLVTSSDTTNIAGGDATAAVSAVSSRAGGVELDVVVRFKNGNSSKLAAGTYSTVLTGTIAAN